MSQDLPNFGEIIERAQSVSGDVASPFPTPGPERVAFEGGRITGMPQYPMVARVEVFNLPHDSEGYEDVLNKQLQGQAVIRFEERTFDGDGNFLVAVCYLEPQARPDGPPAANVDDAREPVPAHQRLA